MSGLWTTLISLIGGVAAAILGVVVGGMVTRKAQSEQWLRDAQMATYAKFLQAYAHVEEELRTAYFSSLPVDVDWASYSAALTSLSLVAGTELSNSARELAEAMAAYGEFVQANAPDLDKERALRQRLAEAQVVFVNTARGSLGLQNLPVPWPLGGPPPDPQGLSPGS